MKYVLLLAATCAVALVLACNNGDGVDITPGATVSPGPGDESPTPTAAADVCQPNPDPASADVATVDSPQTGDSVTSPVTVSGQINAFEAQFKITIFDAASGKIADVPARSEEGQVLSPFSKDVFFSVTEETPACLWVYDASPRDGSPIDVVQIPVTLEPGGEEVCQPNPDQATPEFQVIDQPNADDTVTSPVTISGRIVANEATFSVTIYDAAGGTIVDTSGMNEQTEAGELAAFSIDVPFSVTEETPACIWVYEQSAQDGSPIHVGQIPVTLSP